MKRSKLRLAVQIITIVALLAAVVIMLGPVRAGLERRFRAARDSVVTQIESILGRQISYASISPSVLRYLSVNELTIHGRPGEEAELLTIEQVRVYYRPIRLLQGRFAEAFSEIRIQNTTLIFDTTTDTEISTLVADLFGTLATNGPPSTTDPGEPSPATLPPDIVVSGRNIELILRTEIGRLEVARLFFTTTLADDTVTVRAQGDVRLSETPQTLPFRELAGSIEATGTVDATNGDTILEVALDGLGGDIAEVRAQVVQLRYADGVLEARNVQSREPIDLYARYIQAEGELYARILADGYRVSDLVELRGSLASLNRFLALQVRGQANATITPESFSFGGSLRADVRDISEVPDGELTLRFDGDGESVTVDQLVFNTAIGSASYEGEIGLTPLRPSGRITLRNLTLGGIVPLSLTASLRSSASELEIVTDGFDYAGSRVHLLRGALDLSAAPVGAFTVEIGPEGDSRLEVATQHADDGTLLSARIEGRRIEPQRLVNLQEAVLPGLDLPELAALPDDLLIDTRLLVDLRDGLLVDVPLFYAFDANNPDDNLSFSLRYDDGDMAVRGLTAAYQGFEGSGDFTARIAQGGVVGFSSEVEIEGIEYAFTGRYDPRNSLQISGLHDVDARFFFGERGELVFRASGDLPLPVGIAQEGRLAFRGNGYVLAIDDWRVEVDRLIASGIPYAAVPEASISIAGVFNPTGARLTRIDYLDRFSELTGSGELDWSIESAAGTLTALLNERRPGASTNGREADTVDEAYRIAAGYRDGRLSLEADVTRLPLLRLGVETVRGSVNGTVVVAGPLDALDVTADVGLVNGKFNNDPIEAAGTIEITPRVIRLANASGRYARTRAENVEASLSLDSGELLVAGDLVQSGEDGDVAVAVSAAGAFDGLAGLASVATSDFSGSLRLSGLPVQDDLPSTWEFRVARARGVVSAEGGPSDALRGALESDGSFTARVGAPLPLAFEAIGRIDGGSIEADLTGVNADIARLWSIVASPGFTFTGGTATGSVRIVGPLNDPDFYGTLVAESVLARVDVVPDEIGPGRTFIVFDEKVLTVRETAVPAGAGRALVAMDAVLDRWLPEEFRVTVTTPDDEFVRVAGDFGGVTVDGRARGRIVIAGDAGATEISGTITAASTTITLSEPPEPLQPEEEPIELRVDMTVTTGRAVEFLWPSDAFLILRGSAAVGDSVRITHDTAGGTFSVAGGVEIQGGEVFYFDRSFYIREGRITFDEDEQEFDPLLTVNAEIREVADEGPIRIYLVSDERPLSEFTPRWRSDPPLGEAAILALLGGNVFVQEGGQPLDLGDAVLLGSDVASQFGIIRGFESTVRDALQLDLFSIRTQLFQNLLRSVIETGEGYPLDNTVPSLGQYLDNTTLFMGRYLGTDLFLELLVQLRATEPAEVQPRTLAGIEVESELSLEWQTPFFLLEWTFFPRDPSTLFLSDNTISFSWEYSY